MGGSQCIFPSIFNSFFLLPPCPPHAKRFVVGRLSWQEERLGIHVKWSKKKRFAMWREFSMKEKDDRLLCEFGELEWARLKAESALKKLYDHVVARKREALNKEMASKHLRKRSLGKGMELWAINKNVWEKSGRLSAVANVWRRKKMLEHGWNTCAGYAKKSKVRKVMNLASILLYQKHTMSAVLAEWRREIRKRAIVRDCVVCGLALMKTLAWKRWRSGILHVKLRRRWLRGLLYWWRDVVRARLDFAR